MSKPDSDLLSDSQLDPDDHPEASLPSPEEVGNSIFDEEDDHQGMLYQRLDEDSPEEELAAEQETEDSKPSSSIFDEEYRAPIEDQADSQVEDGSHLKGGVLWEDIPAEEAASDLLEPDAEQSEYEKIAQAEGFRPPPGEEPAEEAGWETGQPIEEETAQAGWQVEESVEEGQESEAAWHLSQPGDREDHDTELEVSESPAFSVETEHDPQSEVEEYETEDEPAHRTRYSKSKKSQVSIPMLILAAVLGPITLLVGYFVYKAVTDNGSARKSSPSQQVNPEEGGLSTLRDKTSSVSPQPRRQFEESEFREFPDPPAMNEAGFNPPSAPLADERKADEELKLARILLERNPKVGRQRLQKLINRFPETSAAAEARTILDEQ